jgi:hypothetical protein
MGSFRESYVFLHDKEEVTVFAFFAAGQQK